MTNRQLAQANIAQMRAPLDDPIIAGFAARLELLWNSGSTAAEFTFRHKFEATELAVGGHPK